MVSFLDSVMDLGNRYLGGEISEIFLDSTNGDYMLHIITDEALKNGYNRYIIIALAQRNRRRRTQEGSPGKQSCQSQT